MKQRTCDIIMLTKASEMSKYGYKDFYAAISSYMCDKCLIDDSGFNISEVMQEALFDLIDSSKISSHFIKDVIRYNRSNCFDSLDYKGIVYMFRNLQVQEGDEVEKHYVNGFTTTLMHSSLETLGIDIDNWEFMFGCPRDMEEI